MGRESQGRDCQSDGKPILSLAPKTVSLRTSVFSLMVLAVLPSVKKSHLLAKIAPLS